MASRHDDQQGESPLYAGGAFLAAFLVMGFLVWLVASNRIVYGSLKPALLFGAMWKWTPSDFGFSQWNYLVTNVQLFVVKPSAVSFAQWAGFITVALRPLFLILMLAYIAVLVFFATRKKTFMRRFTARHLMEISVAQFTGIAPVVAIRKLVAQDKHPLWRRQVTPEEVFLNYRAPASRPEVGLAAPAGAPMIRDNRLDREVARMYFMAVTGNTADGRLISGMLGRQVVNLANDASRSKSVVFADRMSSEGKTLLALWSAVAFGEKEGRDEFCKYRDMLNRSAFGTKDGMANLALAQPLYMKYRKHPVLNKLFAMHHWEHTLLFALLALAQRKGRFTTAEVLWLRPTNRVMFFALNSRGSFTPHTEAATTFTQHTYESMCAKQGRLPLFVNGQGQLQHVIYVDKAVDGLELEYERWAEASDEDEDWWLTEDVWRRTNMTVNDQFRQIGSAVPAGGMPGTDDQATAFDLISRAQADAAAQSEADDLRSDLQGTQGLSGDDALADLLGAKR